MHAAHCIVKLSTNNMMPYHAHHIQAHAHMPRTTKHAAESGEEEKLLSAAWFVPQVVACMKDSCIALEMRTY